MLTEDTEPDFTATIRHHVHDCVVQFPQCSSNGCTIKPEDIQNAKIRTNAGQSKDVKVAVCR